MNGAFLSPPFLNSVVMNRYLPTFLLLISMVGITTGFVSSSNGGPKPERRPFCSSAPTIFMKSIHKIERPENEFRREYEVDRIIGKGRQRDYQVQIEATADECQQLANRFDLQNLYSLGADLSMRRERSSASNKLPGIEIEGTIVARVTQICVRTGEVFDVDVEFPLYAISRPLASSSSSSTVMDEELPPELMEFAAAESAGPTKKQKRSKNENIPARLQEVDLDELQKLLSDIDVEDDVFEDEAIYSTDGILDAGELVSQMFWLKLDPYPKKPGSDPVSFSISG